MTMTNRHMRMHQLQGSRPAGRSGVSNWKQLYKT